MSTSQRSAAKAWSLLSKAIYSKTYLDSPSLITGSHRGSLFFRIGKGGFKFTYNDYKLDYKTYHKTVKKYDICHSFFESDLNIPKYQNTYRLESHNPFKCEIVDKILIDVMRNYLTGLKYQPQVCIQICQRMSAEVRNKICKKSYDRYKVVVIMSIIQKLGQNVQINFGKLCDIQRDTYSSHVVETPEFIAMGLVVGLYYE